MLMPKQIVTQYKRAVIASERQLNMKRAAIAPT
jgi:hypothetical protein